MLRIKSKIQEKLIETRKKRANTRHPETQINDKFSFDSIDSGFDLCNYLADQYTAAIKIKSIRPNKE